MLWNVVSWASHALALLNFQLLGLLAKDLHKIQPVNTASWSGERFQRPCPSAGSIGGEMFLGKEKRLSFSGIASGKLSMFL